VLAAKATDPVDITFEIHELDIPVKAFVDRLPKA
jgi:hypothetical protein